MPDPVDHRNTVTIVVLAARALHGQPIREAIEQAERALAVGCLSHPTAWMQNHEKLEEDVEMLRAALPLVALAEKLAKGQTEEPADG